MMQTTGTPPPLWYCAAFVLIYMHSCFLHHWHHRLSILQVAELGGENEQLHFELQSVSAKLKQAEQSAQQLQHKQSDRSSPQPEQDSARSSRLQSQVEELSEHNTELQAELASALQRLKEGNIQAAHHQKQQQQLREEADHTAWELQHKVDILTEENQSLLTHHAQLGTKFESLTKQLAKAQHAQHAQHAADAHSKASEARELSKAGALQEQIDSLMESSSVQLEQRHRLENQVASLQRQLSHAESALNQQQHKARGHLQAEVATSGQVAVMQRQAESIAEENAALDSQCRQQAAAMKQLQSDVQVSQLVMPSRLTVAASSLLEQPLQDTCRAHTAML